MFGNVVGSVVDRGRRRCGRRQVVVVVDVGRRGCGRCGETSCSRANDYGVQFLTIKNKSFFFRYFIYNTYTCIHARGFILSKSVFF